MLLFVLHELWSIIDDSGAVVSSVVPSYPALLSFHMLAGHLDRAHLAETRKRRRLYVLLTLVFILAGLVGTIVGFLKLLHGMGIAQGPIAKLFHAIWWVPGIPWLWEHASLISPGMPGNWSLYSYVCIGLVFIGVVFRLLAGSKHYDITQSNREARV